MGKSTFIQQQEDKIESFSVKGSSFVKLLVYNHTKKQLDVEFKWGEKFPYYNVPKSVYDRVKTSPSVGKAYNDILRGNYL